MRVDNFRSQLRHEFRNHPLNNLRRLTLKHGGKDGGKINKMPCKPYRIRVLCGHRFRQVNRLYKAFKLFDVELPHLLPQVDQHKAVSKLI